MGLRDWLSIGNNNTNKGRNGTHSSRESSRNMSSRSAVRAEKNGDFPWLDYPNRGWKVPCPACGENVTNEFQAFKDHWKNNTTCPGPTVVDDGTWIGLGVDPSRNLEPGDVGTTANMSEVPEKSNQENPDPLPDGDVFPFFGDNRDQMRTKCPGCNRQINNTQSSFIAHWSNSDSCDGPPITRPRRVDISHSDWNDLVTSLGEHNEGRSIANRDAEPQGQARSISQVTTNCVTDENSSESGSYSQNETGDSGTSGGISPSSRRTSPTSSSVSEENKDRASSDPGGDSEDGGDSHGMVRKRKVPDVVPSVNIQNDLSYEGLEKKEPIGRGGNADVFRITAMNMSGKELALKEPRMSGTMHRESIESMLEEAETWRQLHDHDHIVDVVDYGAEPFPWIAMEYMDGGDLGERLGQMGFDQALWTAITTTTAVRHAHRRGVAHLDLKPENLLFRTVDGKWDVPKVADWGLSRHLIDHSQSIDGLSPQYAAPEQFNPELGKTDDVTDIYQLGSVFYELFTNRPPHEGSPMEIMHSIVSNDPTPPSEIADVPTALDDVLLKALAHDRDERYESVLYLRDDLQDLY